MCNAGRISIITYIEKTDATTDPKVVIVRETGDYCTHAKEIPTFPQINILIEKLLQKYVEIQFQLSTHFALISTMEI